MAWVKVLWIIINLLWLLAVFAVVGRADLRRAPREGSLLFLAAIVGAAVTAEYGPRFAINAPTVLHEGNSSRLLHVIFGIYHWSVGPNFRALAHWAGVVGPGLPLENVASLNLAMHWLNLVFLYALGWKITGSRVAGLVIAFAFATNPLVMVGSRSEESPNFVALYLFVSFYCLLAIQTARESGNRPALRIAWVAHALTLMLLLATRIEMAVGLPFWLVAAHEGAAGRSIAWTGRMAGRVAGSLILSVALALGLLLVERLKLPQDAAFGYHAALRSATGGIAHVFTPISYLLGSAHYLVLLLVPIGVWEAARRKGPLLWLLPVVLLAAAYSVAPDREYINRRHFLSTVPFWYVGAALGLAAVRRWVVARGWVFNAVMVLFFVLLRQPEPRFEGQLDRNEQKEVRFLMDALKRSPECKFVSWVDSVHEPPSRILIFSKSEPPRELTTAAMAPRGEAGCLRFYRNLDCNRLAVDRCDRWLSGIDPLTELRFKNMPYGDPRDYGEYEGEIRLGLYPVTVEDLGAWLREAGAS